MKWDGGKEMNAGQILNPDATPFSLRRDFFFMCIITAIEQDPLFTISRSQGMRGSKSRLAMKRESNSALFLNGIFKRLVS